MKLGETEDDGLDDLRRDMARLVLDEAGRALVLDPTLALSSALVRAVEQKAGEAAERHRQSIPDASRLSEQVLSTLQPELIRIVKAAASGDAEQLATPAERRRKVMVMIGAGVLIAIMMFAAGFLTAKALTPKREEQAVATEKVGLADNIPAPDAEAPSGTPVVAEATAPAPVRSSGQEKETVPTTPRPTSPPVATVTKKTGGPRTNAPPERNNPATNTAAPADTAVAPPSPDSTPG